MDGWKMILVFWDCLFSGVMLVSGSIPSFFLKSPPPTNTSNKTNPTTIAKYELIIWAIKKRQMSQGVLPEIFELLGYLSQKNNLLSVVLVGLQGSWSLYWLAYYNPYITGKYNPLYTLQQPGVLDFIAHFSEDYPYKQLALQNPWGEMVTELTNQIPYTKRKESQTTGFSLKWGHPKKIWRYGSWKKSGEPPGMVLKPCK